MADKSVRVFSQGGHADVKLVDIGGGVHAVAASVSGGVGETKGTATISAATCDTTADLLLAANASRKSAVLHNAGSVPVYVGGSGVSTANGLPLVPGASLVDDRTTGAWYGVTASGTGDVRVCEVA